jgi:hypothetical protein
MARKTIGAWIQQALGGQKTGTATARIGNQVITNEGTVLGTVTGVWRGADATDHAPHEDTLCVQRSEQGDAALLYIPAGAIARVSDQSVVLMVDGAQVTARGWRFRPGWLPQDTVGEVGTGTNTWQPVE